jgi:hypothetical protein
MTYCPFCGKPLVQGAAYCPSCGRQLIDHAGNPIDHVRPSIGATVRKSFRDAGPRVRAQSQTVLVLAIIATMLGGLSIATPASWADTSNNIGATANALGTGLFLLAIVAQYFIMADATRAVRPEFKLTIVGVISVFVINFAYNVIMNFGLLLLVIPGFWLAVKYSTWLPLFLQGEEDSFSKSWLYTTNEFWETAALNVIAWAFLCAAIFVLYAVGIGIVDVWPVAGVVTAPVITVAGYYVGYVTWLMWVYWAAELRTHAQVVAAAVPAAAAT